MSLAALNESNPSSETYWINCVIRLMSCDELADGHITRKHAGTEAKNTRHNIK